MSVYLVSRTNLKRLRNGMVDTRIHTELLDTDDGDGEWDQALGSLPPKTVIKVAGEPVGIEYEHGYCYAVTGWSVVGMGDGLVSVLRNLQDEAADMMDFLLHADIDLTAEDCRCVAWCKQIQDGDIARHVS